jgi:hypothetical protein
MITGYNSETGYYGIKVRRPACVLLCSTLTAAVART